MTLTLQDHLGINGNGQADANAANQNHRKLEAALASLRVDTLEFGLDPTGRTDSSAAIQDAINFAQDAGGGRVWIPAGADALFSSASLAVTASNVQLDGGPGARLIQGGDFSVTFFGSQAAGTTLTANAVQGDRVIAVTSTTGLVAGDWIEVSSDAQWPLCIGTVYYGEMSRVKTVDSSTQITLYGPLRSGPYNTADTAKVYKNTMLENCGVVGGLEIVNPTPGTLSSPAVNCRWCLNSVWDMTTRGIDGSGLSLTACKGARGNVRAYDLTDDVGNGRFGYGVNFANATCDIDELWIWAERCRHGATTGVSSSSRGVPRRITYRGNSTDCTAAAWDTHAMGEDITYAGNVGGTAGSLADQSFGIQVRAPNCRVAGTVEITGARTHGIRLLYDATASSGQNGINCQIDDGVWIHDLVATASTAGIYNSGCAGVRIGKCRFENLSGNAIVNDDDPAGTGKLLIVDPACAYISVGGSTSGSAIDLIDRIPGISTVGQTVSGGGTYNVDPRAGVQRLVVNDATNFTVSKLSGWTPRSGALIVIEVINNFGAAIGTVTFDTGVFLQTGGGFASPAANRRRTALFTWESTQARFVIVGSWSGDLN